MRRFKQAIWETAGRALKALNVLPPGYALPGEELHGRAAKYRPRDPAKLRLRMLFLEELDAVESVWHRFAKNLGPWKGRFRWAAERFIGCGDPANGFALFRCGECGRERKVPFSCKTGKRPPELFRLPAAEFLARLLVQTPPRHQKLVNYYGLYSNKVRGRWKKMGFRLKRAVSKGPKGWLSWRSQLWRVYEADPLGCPLCGTEMELLELVVPP